MLSHHCPCAELDSSDSFLASLLCTGAPGKEEDVTEAVIRQDDLYSLGKISILSACTHFIEPNFLFK